jgi:excisionase family DNA binding protein
MEHHPSTLVTAAPTQVGALYTTAEVAPLVRVHQRTMQAWIRAGMLPAVRYGRLWRIRQADLASFGEVLTRATTPAADASPSPAPAGAAQE